MAGLFLYFAAACPLGGLLYAVSLLLRCTWLFSLAPLALSLLDVVVLLLPPFVPAMHCFRR